MEVADVQADLLALRKLYCLLQGNEGRVQKSGYLELDERAKILLKRLLDDATDKALESRSKIIAAASSVINYNNGGTDDEVRTRCKRGEGCGFCEKKNNANNAANLNVGEAKYWREVDHAIRRIESAISDLRLLQYSMTFTHSQPPLRLNNVSNHIKTSQPFKPHQQICVKPTLIEPDAWRSPLRNIVQPARKHEQEEEMTSSSSLSSQYTYNTDSYSHSYDYSDSESSPGKRLTDVENTSNSSRTSEKSKWRSSSSSFSSACSSSNSNKGNYVLGVIHHQPKPGGGQLRRIIKNKLGFIFHHHHHHHHHHHTSMWKQLRKLVHHKKHKKAKKRRFGRDLNTLVKGFTKHVKHSNKKLGCSHFLNQHRKVRSRGLKLTKTKRIRFWHKTKKPKFSALKMA